MNEKKTYEEKQHAKLAQWRADIDKLKAKAEHASAEMKVEYNQKIADLQARLAAANVKLDEFGSASDDAWKDLKQGVDAAFHDLGEGFKAAASKFKQ